MNEYLNGYFMYLFYKYLFKNKDFYSKWQYQGEINECIWGLMCFLSFTQLPRLTPARGVPLHPGVLDAIGRLY